MPEKQFDLDEGWAFAKESKFTKKMLETRFDRQKFKETKQKEMIERQRKPYSEMDLEEMERMSLLDPVTELYNQRSFLRKLEYELRRAKRYKRPLSLMVLAVDNFAQLQRQYGQMIVDEVMKASARITNACIRDVDIAGRCDSTFIGIIFPETYSSRAMVVAERVRDRIKTEPINSELRHLRVTVSIGVVSFPTHARDEIDLMHKAVDFMTQAATEGGDRINNG
ncbi:MAG: GGDEF domain-containing protein [Candidatus Melainabacteria bacterium]|jgi:diguanylate cyclase (GGDEF)-like protein|nr:GGDEF domain-containing protein [Candidatus Melainabacteria bacterium]MBX9672758.1 GGDEF domain-containing protein [Candidatus Obscuribacterales bacterium]